MIVDKYTGYPIACQASHRQSQKTSGMIELTEENPHVRVFEWLPGQMSESVVLWDDIAVVS
jgi:hypothetical protein